MQTLDEIEWLKQKYCYLELNESKLINIYRFLLVWNTFENKLCNNNAEISKSKDILRDCKFSDKINTLNKEIFNYFKNRYVENGEMNGVFDSFEFKVENIKSETKVILLDDNSQEKELALLYIAFRLRKNLVHGEKNVETLYNKNESFKQINIFLINLIDSYQKDLK
ncbi:MAG: hypothetical protein NTX05_06290 [Fusobacteria bacterium]|nr:hypothetical protein [Fusobacteriota bacterium]